MRRFAVLLAGAAMAAIVATAATVPREADAAGRFETVTKAFTNPSNIAIPNVGTNSGPASLYPSQINASGLKRGKVKDVNLTLRSFEHPLPPSVDIMLAHAGTNRTVMSDAALPPSPSYQPDLDIVLDDEATTVLPANGILTSGRYQPFNYAPNPDAFPPNAPAPSAQYLLKGFDGTKANGGWYLYVVDDDDSSDRGAIEGGWGVTIKARVPR